MSQESWILDSAFTLTSCEFGANPISSLDLSFLNYEVKYID